MACKVLSFVSYKGGSGRSVSLANIAFQLAATGKRVGCVDFDIEGGGLHTILEVEDTAKDSIQQVLMDEQDHRQYLGDNNPPDYWQADVFRDRLLIDVAEATTAGWRRSSKLGGRLFLIQARPDAQATGLVDTGVNLFFRFNRLLRMFAATCELDYILVDCRSGISNLGLPGLAYCNLAVIFFRWGTQHRYGTEKLVQWYRDWLRRGEFKKELFLVASTIDCERIAQAAVEEFCKEDLRADAFSIIPVIKPLEVHDTVFWLEEDDAYALEYKRLGQALAVRARHG